MIKFSYYVADSGSHRIRKIVIDTGAVTTVAGDRIRGYLDDTVGTTAQFAAPSGITTDGTNHYVGDSLNNRIRKIQ